MARRCAHGIVLLSALVLCIGSPSGPSAQEFRISGAWGGKDTEPDIVYGDGQFFVVWTCNDSIYGTRVLSSGMVLDPAGIALPKTYSQSISGTDARPAVSFDGTNFVTAYQSSVFDFFCPISRERSQILAADGNACTTNDTCAGGVCVGGLPLDCDDGVFCNGVEWCNPVQGCQPGTPPDCDDGVFCNGEEYCDEELDLCVSPGNPCPDDGLWCTGVEFCLEEMRMCASTGNPCADGNPCTLEICFEEDRTCQYACNAMNWQDPCCQDPVCAGDPACDGGPGCFIATASFGTEMAGKIDRLRQFRDEVLLAGPVGTALVNAYYRTSPPIAEFIQERKPLRTLVRTLLLPVVGFASLFV